MSSQLARARKLHEAYRAATTTAIEQAAKNLQWAFVPTPLYLAQHAAGIAGFRTLIAATGIAPADVPHAVALALSLRTGQPLDVVTAFVRIVGVDEMLALMALPPEHREASLLRELACPCSFCHAARSNEVSP
jgi:hypothetical protein